VSFVQLRIARRSCSRGSCTDARHRALADQGEEVVTGLQSAKKLVTAQSFLDKDVVALRTPRNIPGILPQAIEIYQKGVASVGMELSLIKCAAINPHPEDVPKLGRLGLQSAVEGEGPAAQDGLTILGTPYGSDEYLLNHARTKMTNEVRHQVEAIRKFVEANPMRHTQAAWLMLNKATRSISTFETRAAQNAIARGRGGRERRPDQ